MALTDAPFLLAWIVAMGLGSRLLERPSIRGAVLFGLVIGLAQNLKYNGWIAGACVGAVCLFHVGMRRDRSALVALGHVVLAAAVAGCVYWPWFHFVEHHVGYARLMEHHRSYTGGLSSWWPHLRLQLAQAIALSGGAWWGALAWLAAWLGWIAVGKGGVAPAVRLRSTLALLIAGISGALALGAMPNLSWWLALACCPWMLRDARPAVQLLAVWWLALSIVTPLYHPYARLWLPIHASGWILIAGVVVGAGQRVRASIGRADPSATLRLGPRERVAMAILVFAIWHDWAAPPRALPMSGVYRPTSVIRDAVDALESGARPILRMVVMARPSVTFYLATAGRVPFSTVGSWKDLDHPADSNTRALVDEALLRQEPNPDAIRAGLLARWQPERVFDADLDNPTLLDINPAAAFDPVVDRRAPLVLYRPRSQ
jgi:hypothetical protein